MRPIVRAARAATLRSAGRAQLAGLSIVARRGRLRGRAVVLSARRTRAKR